MSSEESNQTSSSTNKINQMDLNVTNQAKPSSDLNLNLGWILKSDIINTLVTYSCLLKEASINKKRKEELFYFNTELVKRLSFLRFDKDEEAIDELEFIDESLFKDSFVNNGDLVFELTLNARSDIINLLVRNLSLGVLSKGSESDRKNLVEENNQMIWLLTNLVSKNLKAADKVDHAIYDRPSTRLVLEKFSELESEIRTIRTSTIRDNQVKFDFEIKGIKEFLECEKRTVSELFYCLSVPWYLEFCSFKEKDEMKFGFYLNQASNSQFKWSKWIIKTKFTFIIFHPSDSALNRLKSSSSETFSEESGSGFSSIISREDLVNDYIRNDSFKFGVQMETEPFSFKCKLSTLNY